MARSTGRAAKTLTVADSPPELLLLVVSSSAPGAAARSNAAEVKAGQTQCLGAPSPWRCQPGDGRSPSAAAKIDLLRGRAAPPPASLLLELERLS